MEQYEKAYVSVLLSVNEEGGITPLALRWEDGRKYYFEKVLEEKFAPPPHTGGELTKRYRVLVSGRERAIYCETPTNRWFVEKKR